ncbi:electron transport complex subunit RsxG [Pseudoalteromonas tunicata]|uniref:Ion-translocating oxidoreductase complex subunit G n=1 Tax=Pseudoalteromonas tunicata D2 TaxID=87626 RepID=A4CB95_9GAMM|nr:electron transport complex subunit RsxG [Pseudoalteromonas tunicata]ATC94191.1 electron transport complex protein RnfG [Pseudoalteromonas tunicata]AXT29951.1 electron transport complex subunit RsxG [Pseudoalteromonas tunicata]EAR27632.1 Electron transport complex protein rnfG [Pseudoalteromonas tunicata D2]
MILSSMRKNGLILTLFAIATTGAVTLVQLATAEQIALQEQKKLMNTLSQIIPNDAYDNELYLDCTQITAAELGENQAHTLYRARKNGQNVALLVQSTAPDGYSGKIEIISATYRDGTLAGVRVLKHKETPGLGDKVEPEKSDWIHSFIGQQVESLNDPRFRVKKDGGVIDQFTGATITPRAVVKSVKSANVYAQTHFDALFDAKNDCAGVQ